jgi:hypothetical protein
MASEVCLPTLFAEYSNQAKHDAQIVPVAIIRIKVSKIKTMYNFFFPTQTPGYIVIISRYYTSGRLYFKGFEPAAF